MISLTVFVMTDTGCRGPLYQSEAHKSGKENQKRKDEDMSSFSL